MTKIQVIITDDELLFREGMKLILEQHPAIEVIATAQNGSELISHLQEKGYRPDVILLDLSMPVMDGVSTLAALNSIDHQSQIIILSSHYNDGIIIKMLDDGAAGFLAKNEDPQEVINTVVNVANKGFHINDYILQLIRSRRLLSNKKKQHTELSTREKEVLELICQEMTTKEIAQKLFISPRTVDGHRNNILEKTNSKNTVGLVIYAIEHQLIDVNISKYGE